MSSKEIKAALKAAREALDKKDFQEVLSQCKFVLRIDKTHCTALVFVGLATAELQQLDQAYTAFTRATTHHPDMPLAWQGLADFCTKQNDPKYHKDLTLCYERLAALHESRDAGKFSDFAEKHGDAWRVREQPQQALAVWQDALEKLAGFAPDVAEAKKGSLYRKIAQVIVSQLPVDYDHVAMLSQATACNADLEGMELFVRYLIRLLQVEDDDVINAHREEVEGLLITQLRALQSSHSDSVLCRQLMCLLALVKCQGISGGSSLSEDDIAVCHELTALQEDHAVGRLFSAYTLLVAGKVQQAADAVGQALAHRSSCPLTWCVSAEIHLRLRAFDEALHSARQGLCCFGSAQSKEYLFSSTQLKTAVQLCQVKALLAKDRERFEDAINLCHDVLTRCPEPGVQLLQAKAYMLNGDTTQATDICDSVLRQDRSNHFALFIQSCAEAACEHFRSAEESVNDAIRLDSSVAEYHLHLGCMLLESHETEKQQQAYTCFVKAAQLDPFDSRSFYQLGVLYADLEKNQGKALRCFQKAVDLNSSDSKAVARLGECFQAQGMLTEALELYQRLTISMPASRAHVAWSRLGSLQLDMGQSQEAIASLQTALRSQPRDASTWEALGTAYMDRGSYASALKALLRSVQLANSTYGLCKMADIKSKIGLNSEAITDYRRLLEADDNYLPAWKGLAEAYFLLAESCMEKNFDPTAVDCVGEVLTAISRAVAINPRLMCLWKLMGDACMLIAPLPLDTIKRLSLPSTFSESSQPSTKSEVFTLASRAYVQAIHVSPDQQYNHWLWHDLAVNYYEQVKDEVRSDLQQNLAEQAMKAIQTAIRLQRSEASYWNTLGVISLHSTVNRLALAQHAFITVLQLQPNNARAWSNLGALYISQNNIELAHRAFAKAQAVDPECLGGWLGQAMVAELMQHGETQDLFHHAAELGYHSQAALGLSHHVCSSLVQTPPLLSPLASGLEGKSADDAGGDGSYQVPAEAAPPSLAEDAVADLLEKVSRRHPDNNAALSMLGVVSERRGLFTLAEQVYESVCQNLELVGVGQSTLDVAYSNHARSLCLCKRYTDALSRFALVAQLRVEEYSWWALAAFHVKETLADGTCIQLYEKALKLTASPSDRSAILTAAAMAAYRSGDVDKCRTFLLSSSQGEPCQKGLCALTSLGLLRKDTTLAQAALAELRNADIQDVSLRAARTYIESVYCLLLGDAETACKQWSKEIHRSPADGELWSGLGRFMIQTKTMVDQCHQVTKTATLLKPSLAPSTQLASALSHLSMGRSQTTALYAAQKAIHSLPTSAYAWCGLATCLSAHGSGGGGDVQDASLSRHTGHVGHAAVVPTVDTLVAMCAATARDCGEAAEHASSDNVEHTQAKSLQPLTEHLVLLKHFVRSRGGQADATAEDVELIKPLPTAEKLALRLRLLTLLAEAGRLSAAGPLNTVQLAAVRQLVLANADFPLGLQTLAECYVSAGLPLAAELVLRLSVTVVSRSGGNPAISFLRLAALGLRQCVVGVEASRWLSLAQEAVHEALKFCRQSVAAQVMQALVTFHSGNAKYAARQLDNLVSLCRGSELLGLLQYYTLRARLQLKNYDKAKALLEEMEQSGSPFHLSAFQLFQSLS